MLEVLPVSMTHCLAAATTAFVGWLSLIALRNYYLRYRDDVCKLPSPPSSEASWIWGHERLVWDGEAGETHRRWIQEIGPMVRVSAALGGRNIVRLYLHNSFSRLNASLLVHRWSSLSK
jgi:hypothetical protein